MGARNQAKGQSYELRPLPLSFLMAQQVYLEELHDECPLEAVQLCDGGGSPAQGALHSRPEPAADKDGPEPHGGAASCIVRDPTAGMLDIQFGRATGPHAGRDGAPGPGWHHPRLWGRRRGRSRLLHQLALRSRYLSHHGGCGQAFARMTPAHRSGTDVDRRGARGARPGGEERGHAHTGRQHGRSLRRRRLWPGARAGRGRRV